MKEFESVLAQQEAAGYTLATAHREASTAYKNKMPLMLDMPSIREYIACVAQGIQMEVFNGRDGSQLLYAAQVAITVSRQMERKHATKKRENHKVRGRVAKRPQLVV
jgi:hypothetical protein